MELIHDLKEIPGADLVKPEAINQAMDIIQGHTHHGDVPIGSLTTKQQSLVPDAIADGEKTLKG
jgi:hypothetical protein